MEDDYQSLSASSHHLKDYVIIDALLLDKLPLSFRHSPLDLFIHVQIWWVILSYLTLMVHERLTFSQVHAEVTWETGVYTQNGLPVPQPCVNSRPANLHDVFGFCFLHFCLLFYTFFA